MNLLYKSVWGAFPLLEIILGTVSIRSPTDTNKVYFLASYSFSHNLVMSLCTWLR